MEIASPIHTHMDASPTLPSSRTTLLLLIACLGAGVFLRAWPSDGFKDVGYDEHVYETYVNMAQKQGVWNYDHVIREYFVWQAKRPEAVVPPTRIGFLWPAAVLANLTGFPALVSLRALSLVASILVLAAAALAAYRTGNHKHALVVTALMAVAPLQIHLAQRSLVDEYFALWAVLAAWCLWERFQSPQSNRWMIGYGFSLFVLVLVKENAAFVFIALVCVIATWAVRHRRLDRGLLITTVFAPALAVLLLVLLAGGFREWISFYQMFVAKSRMGAYAIKFQDGTWYRYLLDFTLISPAVVVLVSGRLFQLRKADEADWFWAVLLGASYVAMSCVAYGMSLRFAAYWDLPLRWLAAAQLVSISQRTVRVQPVWILTAMVTILAAVDLVQYWRFFVQGGIYDPVSFHLLRASGFVK